MNKLNSMVAVALLALTFTACKKDKGEPVIVVPPSDGSTLTLNGIAGSEAGSSAANSVYVDFSADKQTPILRDSWNLGFYSGSDFKVILNATIGASAIKINKTDINTVTTADFDPNNLKTGRGGNLYFNNSDDQQEANILNNTAIASISATDSENKVYIVNRTGGSDNVLPTADLFKIRILRKGNGYTLQYAKVTETTFKSIDITKNTTFNFQYVSLVTGNTVSVEPEKLNWDLVWGWSMYKTLYTNTDIGFSGFIPYGFSDLIIINNMGGTQAAEILKSDFAYEDFTEANLSSSKVTFSSARDAIADKWRVTTGTGIKSDRFYLIKDAVGNVYKLKFVSMGVGADGGERGKPVIEYKLIKKG